jgi:DNA-binding Xre family transcriptional regulator
MGLSKEKTVLEKNVITYDILNHISKVLSSNLKDIVIFKMNRT